MTLQGSLLPEVCFPCSKNLTNRKDAGRSFQVSMHKWFWGSTGLGEFSWYSDRLLLYLSRIWLGLTVCAGISLVPLNRGNAAEGPSQSSSGSWLLLGWGLEPFCPVLLSLLSSSPLCQNSQLLLCVACFPRCCFIFRMAAGFKKWWQFWVWIPKPENQNPVHSSHYALFLFWLCQGVMLYWLPLAMAWFQDLHLHWFLFHY